MPSLQTRVSSLILRTIRARREKPDSFCPDGSNSSAPPAKLREAAFSDFDGVMELRRSSGWAADSLENWDRIWRRNPALPHMKGVPPLGWVLETEQKIVGYLGNISLTYYYGQRMLTAVTGSGLVVDPAYRSLSVSLVAAFYRQKNIDLYLTTTAVEAVGKIARAFKSKPLPQSEYDSMLFWVLRPSPFADALVRKLGLRPSFAGIGRAIGSLAVSGDKLLHRRWPSSASRNYTLKDIGVLDIGDDFETLWMHKRQERPRLLADRHPSVLRWHFDIAGDKGSARVLCCYEGKELVGYAVVRHEAASEETGLRRSIIADMLAKDDDPAVLRSLWVAAYEQAMQAGSHLFEVLGFPPGVREVSSKWNPYVRKYPALPFYYKAADPMMQNELVDGAAWYACPFDGDTTLWSFGSI